MHDHIAHGRIAVRKKYRQMFVNRNKEKKIQNAVTTFLSNRCGNTKVAKIFG